MFRNPLASLSGTSMSSYGLTVLHLLRVHLYPNTGPFDYFRAETSPGPVRLILSFGWDEHCQKSFTTSSYRTNRMLALSTTSYD